MLLKSTSLKFSIAIISLLISSFSLAAGTNLNFKNANIRDVIEAVSKITGRNFLIDPRVSGQVTLLSSKDMKPKAIYNVFLSILKIHGFIAVEIDDQVTKIVPNSEMRTSGRIKNLNNDGEQNEVVMEIIPIKHTQATALIPILRPLISRNGHLVGHKDSNNILVSDTKANIEKLKEIISKIDNSNKSKLHIFTLYNAQATNLVATLNAIFNTDKNANDKISISAEKRTNSLLIKSSPAKFEEVKKIIEQLDISKTSSAGVKVIKVNNSDATEIEAIITKMLKTTNTPATTGAGANRVALIQGVVKTAVDKSSNSIAVLGLPESVRIIVNLIKKLDIKRKQVLVEAIIVEVNAEKAEQSGIQWGKALLISSAAFAKSAVEAGTIKEYIGNNSSGNAQYKDNPTVKYQDAFKFSVLTDWLGAKSKANANLLSAPSILTIENEQASIEVGQEVPFITSSKSTSTDGSFKTISRKSVGLKLNITPQINDNGVVKLKIKQEISNVLPSAQAQTNASDIITSKRAISTNVLVKDGNILVLGGLIDDLVIENERPTSFLAQIPIFGYPFRQQVASKSKRNLMIFIRPTIINDETIANSISAQRYDYIRGLQLLKDKDGINLLDDEKHPVLPEYGSSKSATDF